MSTERANNYEPTYRESNVDETLKDHDNRISTNERRWLMGKGFLAAVAAFKGVDFTIAQLGTLL